MFKAILCVIFFMLMGFILIAYYIDYTNKKKEIKDENKNNNKTKQKCSTNFS